MTFIVPGGPTQGKTINVSRGGLCAHLGSPIAVGADIDVELVLLFEDDARSDALRLPVRVVWCTPLDDAQQIGLSFRPLTAEQVEYLSMFLRYLDDGRREPKPDRATGIDDRFG